MSVNWTDTGFSNVGIAGSRTVAAPRPRNLRNFRRVIGDIIAYLSSLSHRKDQYNLSRFHQLDLAYT